MSIKLTKDPINPVNIINSLNTIGNTNVDLRIVNGNTIGNIITFATTGNIGIISTNPSYKLDVSGNINMSGNLYSNGNLINSSNTDYIVSTTISSGIMISDIYTGGNMELSGSVTCSNMSTTSLNINYNQVIAANSLSIDGLIGQYTGNSWNTSTYTWSDLSTSGNHITSVTNGTSILVSNITNGSTVKFISGSTTEMLIFPAPILQTDYTLFHVTKYNGGTRDRIFGGKSRTGSGSENWLSGFWNGKVGVAHQTNTGFIGQQWGEHALTSWVFSTHSNSSMYRSQGVSRTINPSPAQTFPLLTINAGDSLGPSHWAIAEVLVFNRHLNLTEINRIESYLFDKYSVFANNAPTADIPIYPIRFPAGTYATGLTLNTSTLQILKNGNIGICTSTPSYALHLYNNSAAKPSTSTWTVSSDQRLKNNITTANLETCYENIQLIPLKRYTWRDDIYDYTQVGDRSKLGWIAQDVESVFPKAIRTISQYNIPDCKTLNIDQIIATMYGCIQKLIKQNEELENEIIQLEQQKNTL